MKSYVEREPTAYYTTLKEFHHKMRVAYARNQLDLVERLKRQITMYRIQAHSTYGVTIGIPTAFCHLLQRQCTPNDCKCSPMPDGFSDYRTRHAIR
jgi:hypothetical protein